MAATLKYSLKQITDISYSGFHYEIPAETCNMINYLCSQVGSTQLNNNVFSKTRPTAPGPGVKANVELLNDNNRPKKRKANRNMEATDEDWEALRTFQTTKIEQKTGIEADIDQIRLYLNKFTDKTFLDMREKIISAINKILSDTTDDTVVNNIGDIIYDLCSTNKFYSKIFADLFAELCSMFNWLKVIFDKNHANILNEYNNIKYVDSEKDYDGFCEMNKKNERRKSVTSFYLNLGLNGFIPQKNVAILMRNILTTIVSYISLPDKKNEVDELTENVAILFSKDIHYNELIELDVNDELIVGDTQKDVSETISYLAKLKAKDYPSLSNKAIFKYMDLVEM